MAPKIVWTRQALRGFEKVIAYLEKEWTSKEIFQLTSKVDKLLQQLQDQPVLFIASGKFPKLRKAIIDKNNYLVYRWLPSENKIIIINFRGTKQNPIY